MFRRIACSAGLRATCARCYTPSEELKKLYESDFEAQKFPVNLVPSDSILFAKFLFKAAEPKNAFDSIFKDFEAINAAAAKLPVFWERTTSVESVAEFKSLSAPTVFTLMWMENNGMLELIPSVHEAFSTYVNTQRKKAVAKIFVRDPKDTAAVAEGKKVAQELQKANAALNGFTLETVTVVDKDIVSGFAVELQGSYVNNAKGADQKKTVSEDDVDYTNIPAPKYAKTVWEDSVETEILRKYIDQLALYDAEEAKNGV